MASWERFFPDYEIVRWDESNFDVGCCPYVREAYAARKWAFVSDYARFFILNEHGGVYFDTDVEVIKSFDDLLAEGALMGFETDCDGTTLGTVAPGLVMAAPAGLPLYQEVLDLYDQAHFSNADGTLDETTVVERMTQVLLAHGLSARVGIQQVAGMSIYPAEYFNPKDFDTGRLTLTDQTRTIHHYSMSWYDDRRLWEHELAVRLRNTGMNPVAAGWLATFSELVRFADVSRVAQKLKGLAGGRAQK